MFISEQYGGYSEISGEFFDAILDIGYESYLYSFEPSIKNLRDIDLMLMGL